ncbi:hypothetical protein FTO74_12120 [Granulicella sp. WH15]|uniref:hypothetical protein n=1 Tax=Granulicella sp. WH15 TaxID=2602070 RepID=UPI001367236E|nr:hypothetical protein [Granulicella sp. WH15]QHN04036.1 hypothetical protein FTO74_12120 [Granulicella sp. WH15]
MLLLLLPLLLILSLEIWCESSLRKGLRDDRWPHAQVEAARAWVALPFYDWIIRLGVAFCVVLFLFSVRSGHISGAISMLYFPLIAATNLKRIFHPPTTGPRIDWRQSAPISSEHWGEPPQTHS